MTNLDNILKNNSIVREGVKVSKVWGKEVHLVNKSYCGKILDIRARNYLSLHQHLEKDETFYVLSENPVIVTLVDLGSGEHELYLLKTGDLLDVPAHTFHSLLAPVGDSKVIEFSTSDSITDSYRVINSGELPESECLELFERLDNGRSDNSDRRSSNWKGRVTGLYRPSGGISIIPAESSKI